MIAPKLLEKWTYLTFKIGEEVFAVDVRQVLEVLELKNITKLPSTPDFIRGIINLRGRVVPVVDMRLKFGMEATENTIHTCIIVLEIGTGNDKTTIGALADSVKEVFEFDEGQIEPPPRFGSLSKMDFILGIGKREEQFIIILNFNRVFSTDEIIMLGAAGDENPENIEGEETEERFEEEG